LVLQQIRRHVEQLSMFYRTFLLIGLSTAALTAVHSQDRPTITIRKTDVVDIAVENISGPDGSAVAKVLKNDLAVLGYFNVTPAANAGFTVSGSSSGDDLQGVVRDRSGGTVLSNSYSGSARVKAHKFANDIVETLTGNPGIAGSKIAFVSTRSGRKEIYTADYDGSGVQQLTRDNNISVGPALTPDGRRLAYTGYKSGYADIYEIDLNSGARQRIIKFPGTNSGAAYSPEGDRLAVTLSKDGNPELYVTSARGSSARRLTRTAGVESSPTWSPEGDEIIYSSDDRGSPQLFRISAGGGGARLLSTGHSYNTEPNWSPDSRKVAFTVREGGAFHVAVLDLQNGNSRLIAAGEDPVWGADSRHLVFASGGGLYLLDSQTGRKMKVLDGLGEISEPTWSR
jgi:TolB protein